MPTYEYQCAACSHRFELYQSITARPIRKCPSCGQRRVSRLIGTGAGIIFRGSGFHQTDYRSESYKKAAQAEKGTAPKADDTAKPTTDASKPAAETAPKPARSKEEGRSPGPPAES